MIDSKIQDIAGQLKNVVNEQLAVAKDALTKIPDGDTKQNLEALLKKASTGKLSSEDAQKELKKILSNAR
jgi:hypothetical protein